MVATVAAARHMKDKPILTSSRYTRAIPTACSTRLQVRSPHSLLSSTAYLARNPLPPPSPLPLPSIDPSETVDLSADPAFAASLQTMLSRYAQLATQGRDVFAFADMVKETSRFYPAGHTCVSGVNDSCAIAQTQGLVQPCGQTNQLP
jgi:hypothetical protein